jgi:hypothetical protein
MEQSNSTDTKWTDMYLQSLTEKERKGYEIAKSHLSDSFDLSKSLGFLQWKKNQLNHSL